MLSFLTACANKSDNNAESLAQNATTTYTVQPETVCGKLPLDMKLNK